MALLHQTYKNESHAADCLTIMEPNERPQSALARGVKITEFKETKINPVPVVQEESEALLEEYLSPRRLRDLTGVENLEEVHYLEMKVDTTDTSLGNFGALLPNLTQLKLSNSIITNIRDLGSSLTSVRILWMARCCLEDIDGVSTMNNIQELYLAYNEIYDISPLSMLENMKILDLEGNNIEEISQVEFLALCIKLTHLTLEANPICVLPSPDADGTDYDYRSAVHRCVPQVQYLDDEPLIGPSTSRSGSVFEEDWKLLEELMREGSFPESDDTTDSFGGRPTTALRPTTGYRPGTALKPQTAKRPGSANRRPGSGYRPGTGRPGSAGRPSTGRPGSSELDPTTEDDSSDLTRGGVVCGNPSKALRARSRNISKLSPTKSTPNAFAQLRHKPEHTYQEENLEDDEKMQSLMVELKEWRQDHQKRKMEIEASKGPQVLRIDHDDAVSLSDDESSEEVTSDLGEDDLPTSISFHSYNSQHRLTNDSGIMAELQTDSQADLIPHPPSGGARPKGRTIPSHINKGRLLHGESPEATEDYSSSPESLQGYRRSDHADVPPSSPPIPDTRPFSGPETGSPGSYRFDPVDKSEPKSIDKTKPVIRAAVYSPEQRVAPPGPRANTSRAALGQPQPVRIRRQLPQVPILPSKTSVPK